MSTLELIYFVAAALLLVQAETEKKPPPSCEPDLIVDCMRYYEDVVWSKDETDMCKVVLNRCIFNFENCYRFRQEQPLLKEIPKEKCQELCVNDCSQAPKKAVCAYHGDKYCQFESTCEREKHICNSGECWFETHSVNCDTHPSSCPAQI